MKKIVTNKNRLKAMLVIAEVLYLQLSCQGVKRTDQDVHRVLWYFGANRRRLAQNNKKASQITKCYISSFHDFILVIGRCEKTQFWSYSWLFTTQYGHKLALARIGPFCQYLRIRVFGAFFIIFATASTSVCVLLMSYQLWFWVKEIKARRDEIFL